MQVAENLPFIKLTSLSKILEDYLESDKYMTMEMCKMDLFSLIQTTGAIKENSMIRYIFTQICNGVHSLHTKVKFAHLDLKLENVLVGSDYKLKLCDFGFA